MAGDLLEPRGGAHRRELVQLDKHAHAQRPMHARLEPAGGPCDREGDGEAAAGAQDAVRLAEGGVVEAGLHDGLAVVKGAAEGNVMDVRVGDRDHLQLLRLRRTPVGIHDEALDALLAAQAVDGRRARVTRGADEQRQALLAPSEQVAQRQALASASGFTARVDVRSGLSQHPASSSVLRSNS